MSLESDTKLKYRSPVQIGPRVPEFQSRRVENEDLEVITGQKSGLMSDSSLAKNSFVDPEIRSLDPGRGAINASPFSVSSLSRTKVVVQLLRASKTS